MGKAPDLIILDEPTNNLDLENVEILTSALQDYKGSLLVISHDQEFLKDLKVEKEIF
jgi:ATPase subunit of ABC transporter with duplicated ATPase domains